MLGVHEVDGQVEGAQHDVAVGIAVVRRALGRALGWALRGGGGPAVG